jgi:hypothetical protein
VLCRYELLEDVCAMGFHGGGADRQELGDLLVGPTFRDQLKISRSRADSAS